MNRHACQCRLLLVALLLLPVTACRAQQRAPRQEIALRPAMEAIRESVVPRLHERVAEAGDDTGLAIMPAKPYAWHHAPTDDGATIDLTLKVDANDAYDRAVLTLWNWHNIPVHQQAVAGATSSDIRLRVHGYGTYLITLDAFAEDKCVYRLARSVSVAPDANLHQQAWNKGDYWLGICAFPGRFHWSNRGKPVLPEGLGEQEARELEARLIAQLGLSRVRLDVSMVMPENDKQAIDWKRMDASVAAWVGAKPQAAAELALQVMHPPDWAIDPKYKDEREGLWRFPRREDAYRRYVREIVSRYGKHAAFVQVYNEPDQVEFWPGEPSEFIAEVRRAKEEIRNVLPEVPITNGGYAFIDPKKSEYYVKELKGVLDLQAYHSHGNLRELIRDHDMMVKLHKDAGYQKPRFINTECGYATWRLDQERSQAIAVLQKILYSWAHGDEGMLLFCSRMTKGPGRWDRDFGLIDYNFCPRFAYGAVAAFTRTYAGAKLDRIITDEGRAHVYVFKRGDHHIVAVFAPSEPVMITLRSEAREGHIMDAMGNLTKLDDSTQIQIEATPYPKTVILQGARDVR